MRNRSSLKLEGKVKTHERKRSLKSLKVRRLEKEASNLDITVAELKRRRAHDIAKQSRERLARRKLREVPGASSSIAA